jgi:hypothetical protein
MNVASLCGGATGQERCRVLLLAVVSGTLLIGLVPLLVIVPLIVFWAWMFKDMMKSNDVSSIYRPYWMMAIIFLNIPAAVFYYITVHKNR